MGAFSEVSGQKQLLGITGDFLNEERQGSVQFLLCEFKRVTWWKEMSSGGKSVAEIPWQQV